MRNGKIKWELIMVNSFFPRRFTVFERGIILVMIHQMFFVARDWSNRIM